MTATERIRVLVADDHAVVRTGLEQLLASSRASWSVTRGSGW